MELRQSTTPAVAAKVRYAAEGSFTVSAGKSLEIKGDEDELDASVPAGKTWTVRVELHIDES